MGIIQKQTIKGSIITYIGVIIGFITGGLLLPKYLSAEQNGVLELLVAYSLVFASLATLGINAISNRLFPYFRDKKTNHNGYFFILVCVSLAGFFLSILIFLLFKPIIIKTDLEKYALFAKYVNYIIPLSFFSLVFLVIDIYYSVLFNAVKGIFIKEFLQRIFIFAAILFIIFKLCDFESFLLIWVIALSLPGLIILINLIIDKEFIVKPKLSFLTTDLKRSMISVGAYGIIIAFSNIIIQYVDRIMINEMLGLEATGIYGRTFFFGVLIILPIRALNKISIVVIADAWKKNDIKTINDIYSSTTINQLIFGLLLFIGIWANIGNVFKIMPEVYNEGKYVIFFIGLANLFVMASGVSGPILSTSKYFKALSYFVIIFGLLVVITNYIFIDKFGMTGAAVASALSSFCFCLMRYIYLYKRYKMQPYRFKHLIIILIGIISFFASTLIPEIDNPLKPNLFLIIDIFVRSSTILLIYGVLIIITGVSVAVNEKYNNFIIKIRSLLNKS
ncbi:lipopolysaccharide biosynthesis protein [Bacteroidota bacterium]